MLALYTEHKANACRLQKRIDTWTRQVTSSCQSERCQESTHEVRRGTYMRQFTCYKSNEMKKASKHNSGIQKIFCKDVTMMTNTASLCQILGGLRNILFSMANLQWKTTPVLQHERNALETRNWVVSLNTKGVQGPLNQLLDFVEAWWTCERDFIRKDNDSSFSADKSTKKPTIRLTWRK